MAETFLDRLVKEHEDLDNKVCKLQDFLKTEAFFNLGGADKILLKAQLETMRTYLDILSVRIALLKK